MREHLIGYLEHLCVNAPLLRFLVFGEIAGLVLMIVAFFGTEPGTGTHVVVILNIIGLVGLITVTGGAVLACDRLLPNQRYNP